MDQEIDPQRRSPMFTRRDWIRTSGALAAGVVSNTGARAQSWPTRPIHLTVPLPPGGSIDFYARAVAEPLSRRLGQPVVVENRSGADGRIGMSYLARQPADGYSLGVASLTNAIHPALFKDIPYDIVRDFQPIGIIADSPMVLVAGPAAAGVRTAAELVQVARTHPDKVTYGSSGNGSPFHLTSELLASKTRVQMLHVPYRGSAQLLQALIAGDVWFGSVSVGPYMPHIAAGRLKALATTLPEGRLPILPDVPALNESLGTNTLSLTAWIGLVAPAGVPPEIVARYNAELRTIVTDAEFDRSKLRPQGYRAIASTPANMTEILRSDIARYAQVVRQARITAD